MGFKNKSPLSNKALFKFWSVRDCAVYQQAAVVRLTASCKIVVPLYTVFMDSKFTVQLLYNVIPDLS